MKIASIVMRNGAHSPSQVDFPRVPEKTMGTPWWQGRDDWEDIYNMNPGALVSGKIWRARCGMNHGGVGSALRVGSTDDWREIVGV